MFKFFARVGGCGQGDVGHVRYVVDLGVQIAGWRHCFFGIVSLAGGQHGVRGTVLRRHWLVLGYWCVPGIGCDQTA